MIFNPLIGEGSEPIQVSASAMSSRNGNCVLLTISEQYLHGPLAERSTRYRITLDDAETLARGIVAALKTADSKQEES